MVGLPGANSLRQKILKLDSAARRLVELRDRWLNPPEWVAWVEEQVAGYPKRAAARVEMAAKALKARTLTSLYNARPQWLADAHAALDAALEAAYWWEADISEENAPGGVVGVEFGGGGFLMWILLKSKTYPRG